jgi:group II intron reverse transcriptase/maturase
VLDKAVSRVSMGHEKSERRSRSEDAGEPSRWDPAEQRAAPEHGTGEGKHGWTTMGQVDVSTRLRRIAETAKAAPELSFTTLAHHIDEDWLREAFHRTRRDAAPGVDGATAEQYAARLEDNLAGLRERLRSGSYRAPPVRRVHIPKGSGQETRPIGVPTFEDKVAQRAVAMVLEAVYEQDFQPFSYGFRPGRSAHDALDELRQTAMDVHGGWVVEVDIRKCFDTIVHAELMEVLRRRIRDGVLLRLIGKWLHAGVMERDNLYYPEAGTPQGGVISPLLANVFLHDVVDEWVVKDVRPRLRGRAGLVRYADDMVFVFELEEDARRVLEVLPKRFGKYGLTLHPDKTRLVDFRRPPRHPPESGSGGSGPGSFGFLGFTHHWARSRAGAWVVKRRTAKDRFRRTLRRLHDYCRAHRHDPVQAQQRALNRRLRGHYAYFGMTGNTVALTRMYRGVRAAWRRWLNMRSQRAHMTWARFYELLKRLPLAPPRLAPRYAS